MNKEQQIAEIAEILKNSATESAKYFQRKIKKAFKSGAKQLKRSDCEKSIHDIAAEALYNAGYRKTFTSDLASDTQKAYKEGYIKGFADGEEEFEIIKNRNAELIKERDGTKAVKEFAEKLKAKVLDKTYINKDFNINISDIYKMIEETLKEYE